MRDYKETRYYPLATELGTLIIWANGTDEHGRQSVGFRTEHDHNRHESNAPAGGWDGIAETVTINRVDYYAHGFARINTAGEVVQMNPHTFAGSLRRAEIFSNDKGSDSANAKFDAIMTDALTKWAQSDDGRRILREGRHISASNVARDLEREISELETQLRDKRGQLRQAERMAARNAPAEVLACEALGTNHSGDRAMVGTGSQDGPRLMCGFHASQL